MKEPDPYFMNDCRKWEAVYKLLDRVSTEPFDCGTLCGSACCHGQGYDSEMGIYLFPGEHLFLKDRAPWLEWEEQDPLELGFPASWNTPNTWSNSRPFAR